ncbi:MAG TPA: HEPN domain-containing protein [Candidatus Gastranaerophilales bacterium]|nr:HEPN domain-containing protein [Candidatus Gastranaerophilales bacterium]
MERYEIWFNIAEEDLQAAEWSFKGNQFLWSVFMCQQCVEKAIKAIYIYKNEKDAPKKHDLIYLSEITKLTEKLSEETKILFRYLNVYYIETRYAEKRNELKVKCTKENTLKIINQTREVFKWLKNQL